MMTVRHCCSAISFLFVGFWLSSSSLGDEPAFLKNTPADRVAVFYLPDVLPHVERTLLSKQFQDLVAGINEMSNAPPQDPVQWLATVQQNAAPFIPTEIAVTLNGESLSQLSRLMSIGMWLGLTNGAIKADDSEALQKIHARMIADVPKLELTGLDVWLNFRNPLPAGIAFGQVNQIATQLRTMDYVDVEQTGTSFRFRVRLGDAVDMEALPLFLLGLGAVSDAGSDIAGKLATALADLRLDVRFRMIGSAIQLTFGATDDAEGSLSPDDLGELWSDDPSTVMFMNYRAGNFQREVQTLLETWRLWENTPTGQQTLVLDDEDLIGSLKEIVRLLNQGSANGSMRVSWTETMDLIWHEYDVNPVATLRDSSITDFIPKNAGIVAVTSVDSIADQWNNQLSAFEDRLATKSLQYDLSGKTAQAQMIETVTQFYYERLLEFRKLIREEGSNIFESPTIAITNGGGDIKSLTVLFEADNEMNKLKAKNVRCPQFAFVGKVKEGADAGAFVESVWKAFLEGIFSETADFRLTAPTQFGLGQPTLSFLAYWQKLLPYKIDIRTVDGFAPHYVELPGDWFLLSSSPALSQSIMKASTNASERFVLPNTDAQLIGFGSVPSKALVELINSTVSPIDRFMSRDDTLDIAGPAIEAFRAVAMDNVQDYRGFTRFVNVMVNLTEAIDEITWTSIQKAQQRTLNGSIKFVSP